MKFFKESLASEKTQSLIDKLIKELAKNDLYPDVYATGKNSIAMYISDGDWKHDHLLADNIVSDVLKGTSFDIEHEIVGESDSDTFSALHNIFIKKEIEETIDDQTIKSIEARVVDPHEYDGKVECNWCGHMVPEEDVIYDDVFGYMCKHCQADIDLADIRADLDMEESLHGDEIEQHKEIMDKIGVKTLGDLKTFKDHSNPQLSDIEQAREYEKEFDLEEALGLKEDINEAWYEKYYNVLDNLDDVNLSVSEDNLISAANVPGYDGIEHIAWLVAKPEYEERLAFDGYDLVELVMEDGKEYIAYVGGYPSMVFNIDDEIKNIFEKTEESLTEKLPEEKLSILRDVSVAGNNIKEIQKDFDDYNVTVKNFRVNPYNSQFHLVDIVGIESDLERLQADEDMYDSEIEKLEESNKNTNIDNELLKWAKADALDYGLPIDDFDQFRKIAKEDGLNVSENDYYKYLDYYEEHKNDYLDDEEYEDNLDESFNDRYTIEINGEILTDDLGEPYHFNSYEEAQEYIDEEELENASVTRQYGLAESIKKADIDEKLIQGKSDKTSQKNIETEIKAGKDPKQAAAIAYAVQEKNK